MAVVALTHIISEGLGEILGWTGDEVCLRYRRGTLYCVFFRGLETLKIQWKVPFSSRCNKIMLGFLLRK